MPSHITALAPAIARLASALVLAFALTAPPQHSAKAQTAVELELVLAIDTSTSVDAGEFALQTQGLSEAFLHPDVVQAVKLAGPRGVAVSVVHWAGRNKQETVVDWHLVTDGASAAKLAAAIATVPRRIRGLTDIAGAISHSVASITSNGFSGERKVVDVSGDGSSEARSTRLARDGAIARGITINGLVIRQKDYSLGELAYVDLRQHYERNVIGGPGAFLMTARDFEDFRIAIRRKLVREITGPLSARSEHAAPGPNRGKSGTNTKN